MNKRALNKSRHNPTMHLKVPYGAYKKANENGVLQEFLFYYQVKSINTQGYLQSGKKIHQIQAITGYSHSYIRKMIASCVKLGFLVSNKGNLSVVSYDRFWSGIGLDLYGENRLRLVKIVANKSSFKSDLYYSEIKCNLRKQIRKIAELSVDTVNVEKKIHKDVTLSCKGVANLFGYKTGSKGYKIEQRLKDDCLLLIENRTRIIAYNTTYDAFASLELHSSYFFVDGCIIKQLPNLLFPVL